MKPTAALLPRFAGELQACFDEGVRDGVAGKSMDDCRFRSHAKQVAWATGLHQGQRQAEQSAQARPTPAEAARALPPLALLKALTAPWNDRSPFWSPQYASDQLAHIWQSDRVSACGRFVWPSSRLHERIESIHSAVMCCPECSAWVKRLGVEVRGDEQS